MSLSKSLLFTVLVSTLPSYRIHSIHKEGQSACREIEVSWIKSDTSRGAGNGSIELEFHGDRSQFAVYLLTNEGKIKLNSLESTITNLKKGRHGVVITGEREDSNFCQKFFEVVIN